MYKVDYVKEKRPSKVVGGMISFPPKNNYASIYINNKDTEEQMYISGCLVYTCTSVRA